MVVVVSEPFIYEVLKASLALFIIVDPIGNVPIFIGLTKGMSQKQRKNALRTATLVAFVLLVIFALLGQQVLSIFGITLQSFMIAGGILLLILATKILISGRWDETAPPESVGAVPIAFPLLVGPGAITTAIVTLQTSGMVVTLASIVVTFGVSWAILRSIDQIYKFLGRTGSAVIARLMAIFIAAIAVGFVVNGVKYYFP
jgi:multiple antibiotic resistance protein